MKTSQKMKKKNKKFTKKNENFAKDEKIYKKLKFYDLEELTLKFTYLH
jgi:hypothetical protein